MPPAAMLRKKLLRLALITSSVLAAIISNGRPVRAEEPQKEEPFSAAMMPCDEIVVALRAINRDVHWYANFGYYSKIHDFGWYTTGEDRVVPIPGGKLLAVDVNTGRRRVLIDDPQGGVRDPVVSYDAKKILFSYRKGKSHHYHLYEINVDGSGLRQLTDGPYDDIEACFLPDRDIVFVSSRCKRWVNCWMTQVAILHRCRADGSEIRVLSSNIEHDNTPWVLPGGQVLFTRWEYVDRSQLDYHHLWTIAPDGTRQTVFFGNLHPGTVMIDAKPIPGSRKVIASFSGGHGRREHDGAITILDPRGGPDHQKGAQHMQGRGGRDPWAFSEKLFMVAEGERVVLFDDKNRSASLFECMPEEKEKALCVHEPRPIMPRPREKLVQPMTDWRAEYGRLALVDVYQGRNMAGVKRGEIKELLILETLPKPINYTGGMDPITYGGSFTLERVLGTVPVEEDGSAYMELPPLRSFFFVALDADGMAVKRMQSFTSVMPGETTTCFGCHEQRTQAAMNVPRTKTMALMRPPSRVKPYEDCPDVFDFPRDIQPILDKLCVDCHGYEKTERGGPFAGKVILSGDRGPLYSHAYFMLTTTRLFSDGRNLAKSNYAPRTLGSGASRLLRMLDGSHHGVKANEHEKRMLRLWIDAGAPYPGTYASLGCGAIGGFVGGKQLLNYDKKWPTTVAGAEVIQRRCAKCHPKRKSHVEEYPMQLPPALCDRSSFSEAEVLHRKYDPAKPKLPLSRHILFNLSRPDKSLMLLAPLSKASGGFGSCRDENGKPAEVFADANDPDYNKLLAMIAAGHEKLEEVKRFDMPGFRPTPGWTREMKRYNILPEDFSLSSEQPIDVYEVERRYWQSMWHKPEKP